MTNTDELNMNRKSNEYVIFQMSYTTNVLFSLQNSGRKV